MKPCPSLSELPPPPPERTGWPWTEERAALPKTMAGGRSWPTVSIVIPSFNQAAFIEETIRSVLLQGYSNLELVIVDGGSDDGSVGIIKKYARWLSHWVSEPDRGQSHAVNKGIAETSGEILHWINSDDLLLPNALATVGRLFVENKGCRMVTGQAKVIDARGERIAELTSRFSSWEDFATRRCTIAQVATFFDRGLFDEFGMVDEALDYCMDSDLLLRFTRESMPVICDACLTAYRRHHRTKFEHNQVAGCKEADKTYLKHLSGTGLKPLYRRWAAHHWLAVSSFDDIPFIDRALSIVEAVRMQPAILRTRHLPRVILRAIRIALIEALQRANAQSTFLHVTSSRGG